MEGWHEAAAADEVLLNLLLLLLRGVGQQVAASRLAAELGQLLRHAGVVEEVRVAGCV
jgi:hypothetical protein